MWQWYKTFLKREYHRSIPNGLIFRGKKYFSYSRLPFSESAIQGLSSRQRMVLTFLVISIVVGVLLNWHLLLVLVISILTILYFIDLLFNLFIVYRSFFKTPEISITTKQINSFSSSWPMYTILCPLYKETDVVRQFIDAISRISYPKNKLQVLLLLEEDDFETQRKILSIVLPSYCEVVVVPDCKPKTKPKALNYGLQRAIGEYIVIYDAEDIPDPLQLKKVILAFQKAVPRVVCIQAKLSFYNQDQNLLTRLFALEYALWFDLVLTGLQSIDAPLPLGGTSNHFKTADLKKLGGWDAFNVTEDADLGVRLSQHGYQTAMVGSYTLEEANSKLVNWFWQRTRWVKGYMQTYLVHTRKTPVRHSWKLLHWITFQLIVGGKVLSMLINPIMWVVTIFYFVFKSSWGIFIESLFITPIFYIGVFALFIGNFLYIYYYMLGSAKRGQWSLIPYSLLTPAYWLCMSFASYYAICELIIRPYYWHKTRHGIHLEEENSFIRNIYVGARRRVYEFLPT